MLPAPMAPVSARARTFMQRLYEAGTAEYRRQILDSLPAESRAAPARRRLRRRRMDIASPSTYGHPCVQSGRDRGGDRTRRRGRRRGYDVRVGDLEERWPFDDSTIDVVHANQVIEHVRRLDHFVGEVRRVLRPDGVAVTCTENLASWHNVAALALGFMPFSLTNVSNTGPREPVRASPGRADRRRREVAAHPRSDHGRPPVAVRRARLRSRPHVRRRLLPGGGRLAVRLAARDPRHAHFIGVVARKPSV